MPVDYFMLAVRLAPAAIEQGIRGSDAGCRWRIRRIHDAL